MKRTKFIMLTLVAALILMGAGYAAWTQVFTIDSTVKTGELFVEVKNTSNIYEILDADGNVLSSGIPNDEGDYLDFKVTPTVISDSDREGTERQTLTDITFSIVDMYPGVRQTSVFTFKNLGTLRTIATLDESLIVPSGGNALWDGLVIKVNGEKVGGSAEEKLQNLADAIRSEIAVLEPGAEATVTIVQELPYSTENAENLTVKWTVPITFEQYTAQAEE